MDNSLKKWRITNFSNKIGLFDTTKQTFINGSGDVVLSFPFKDCILEWGMSDEEAGREEKFFHETLDRADIDTLRDPKVLTGFEKIDKDGIHKIENPDEIEFWDEKWELRENLLIKGNNLIALYSLRKKLAGKVKLIYIDPPYNTGSDGFRYNDNFNHSTWLVFMRNRLEIARELLRDDGVIFVQCDDNEQAYLKVLMDEVFKWQNFIDTFIWKNTDNAPTLSKKTRWWWEFIHCYEKNIDLTKPYKWKESNNDDAPLLNSWNSIGILNFPESIIKFWIPDGIYQKWTYDRIELLDNLEVKNWVNKNTIRIKGEFKWGQKNTDEEIKNWTYFLIKTIKFSIRYQRISWTNVAPEKFIDELYLNKSIWVETNEDSKKHIDNLGLNFPSYPKPESLIKFFLKATTEENDIILDFCLWSGTTSAVAHKMGRRWIGIEQMDYIEEVAKLRLQKVIEWEQWGISKSVEWQWGGSFVYMELKAYNIEFIERIESARTKEELHAVYIEMASNAFLQFWFDRRDFERDENYRALPLEEQKVKLRELLDLNQLYLNVGDMNDSRHRVSALEKSLTEKFYGKE